jgi:3-oxosteroid 1-dehydrogenase
MSAPWDETYDVVVVGGGGGGLTAAYTAGLAGLRTVVLEKAEVFGGMTAYAGACLWLPGNHITAQAAEGDSVQGALTYLRATVGDPELEDRQRAYVSTSAELVQFLTRDPAIRFVYTPFPDYYDAPGRVRGGRGITPEKVPATELGDLVDLVRPVQAADRLGRTVKRRTLHGGQALIGRLLLAISRVGNVDVRPGTPFDSLVTADGRVTGVTALRDGRPVRIGASRGVLLAAGGFEANAELRRKWQGRDARWTNAPATHTGDAILAAAGLGARLAGLENGWWATNLVYPGSPETSAFVCGFRGGLFVNGTGRRFANESLPYARMGSEIIALEQAGIAVLPVWWIFDDRFPTVPAIPAAEPDRAEARAAGLWHTAETIEDLAGQLGLPGHELAATIARFNSFAATGIDEDFHRGDDEYDRFFSPGAGPNSCLVAVDQPPYHAVRIELGDLGTKGGVVTDADARVLHEDGVPIAGLYATGNTTASVTGAVYPGPGAPIGTSMVFGYRAVRHMAARALS